MVMVEVMGSFVHIKEISFFFFSKENRERPFFPLSMIFLSDMFVTPKRKKQLTNVQLEWDIWNRWSRGCPWIAYDKATRDKKENFSCSDCP